MRLRSIFFYTLFFLPVLSFAQILQPTHWSYSTSKNDVTVGDELELIFTAAIDNGWYIYSVGFDPDCGPIPMSVSYENISGFERVGELRAIKDKEKFDKIFECDVRVFEKTAEFRQTVKITSTNPTLKGAFEGQVCSEVEGKCVLYEGDFNFTLNVKPGAKQIKEPISTTKPQQEEVKEPVPAADTATTRTTAGALEEKSSQTSTECSGPALDESILEGTPSYGNESFIALLIIAFIAGLTSLITPCVFPMIPMTVTFFLKDNQSKSAGIKKAVIFGLSIIVLYTTAGTLFAILLGEDGLNALATHWALNLFIFVVFIIFALSFFGLFEITAPHQLVNKVDQQAEKGGLLGVFFMAATLVLVSFSCTVPIVGSVLALSASGAGAILKPILMMFFYSLAFALPFTFFAFFPELIKSLPKSGGWLNTVKVSLAFLELALSLKFFSIADQAYHWGLLDREINIALWIVIFTLWGIYLLGKIRLPHDSVVEKVGIGRLMLVVGIFSFVVYLAPGLWGAPLKALAGYLPPMHTHDFNLMAISKAQQSSSCGEPRHADFLHLPHGLEGYFDYCQALECARSQNKPLFIDFTGHGCTNCREMEAVVWSNPAVLKRLQEDFVIVALYVDDRTELPESEWYTSSHDGKVKKTIGKQNADLQIANLNNNAQPFYVLLGPDERVLAWPYAYDRDAEKFVDFLESGKKKYEELYAD